jgi:2-methylisocitrate lyase-like PEP mutase family enzyme
MDKSTQRKKAQAFLALHHDPKLLVLPNIWDPVGARMLEAAGFPAVATASAAVAFSLGYDDGERITFDTMLDTITRVAGAVDVPVTADVESGYASDLDDLADNIRRVIRAGAVGINIEDSTRESGPLRDIEDQCGRIRAARAAADLEDIPLVINARIDVFMSGQEADDRTAQVEETIKRALAFTAAGADCVYPILAGDLETLGAIQSQVSTPVNVYGCESAAPMRDLEAAGISRLSIGPWLLKASLTRMREVAATLKDYGSYEIFTDGTMTTDEVRRIVRDGDME